MLRCHKRPAYQSAIPPTKASSLPKRRSYRLSHRLCSLAAAALVSISPLAWAETKAPAKALDANVAQILRAAPDGPILLEGIDRGLITIESIPAENTTRSRMESVSPGLAATARFSKPSIEEITGQARITEENFDEVVEQVYAAAATLYPQWARNADGSPLKPEEIQNALASIQYAKGPAAVKKRFHTEWSAEQRARFIRAANQELAQLAKASSLNAETVRRVLLHVGTIVAIGDNYRPNPADPKTLTNLSNLTRNTAHLLLLCRELKAGELPFMRYIDPNDRLNDRDRYRQPLIRKTLLVSNRPLFGEQDTLTHVLADFRTYAASDLAIAKVVAEANQAKAEANQAKAEATVSTLTSYFTLQMSNTNQALMTRLKDYLLAAREDQARIRPEIVKFAQRYTELYKQLAKQVAELRQDPSVPQHAVDEGVSWANKTIGLFNEAISMFDERLQLAPLK